MRGNPGGKGVDQGGVRKIGGGGKKKKKIPKKDTLTRGNNRKRKKTGKESGEKESTCRRKHIE